MKKSNRRAAWLLSLCMALGLVLPGSTAALAAADDAADGTLEFPEAGITLHLPEEFENTHGVIIPYGGFDVTGGAGIYETALLYFAMDQEAYDTYTENTNPTEEEFNNFWNSSAWLVLILSADNGLTFDEVNEYADGELDPSAAQEICTAGDCTHYLYETGESLPEDTDAVFLEEFKTLRGLTGELLDGSEFGTPVDPMDSMTGRRIQFETTDTDGNPVNSEELFGAHEITMVNIWASWCGYCIDEMEELEAINGRLAEKVCAVVGLLADGDEEAALASGLETLKEKGVTYTNLLPPENFSDIFYLTAYPTTYFVNREGEIVGTPIVGAMIDTYEPMVEALLAGDGPTAVILPEEVPEEASEQEEESQLAARVETNDDSVYRVIVLDEDENPVPGVMVQFCSDTACMMGETDESGTALFQEPVGHYTVHILKAPEEYITEDDEYILEAYADLTIYLYRS